MHGRDPSLLSPRGPPGASAVEPVHGGHFSLASPHVTGSSVSLLVGSAARPLFSDREAGCGAAPEVQRAAGGACTAGALRLVQVAPGTCLPTRHHSSLQLLSFTHSSSSLYLESSAEITHPVFLLSADGSHCRPKTKSHLGWRLHRHRLGYSMQNACRNIYSSRSLNCIPFVKCLKLHSLLGFLRWVMISAGGQLLPA